MNAIDTNVFIYAFDDSSPIKREKARKLLSTVSDGVLLWQVVCEFISASRKSIGQNADYTVIWDRIAELQQTFPVVLPNSQILIRAKSFVVSNGFQFWDAMIYAACLEAGVTRLYSEDLPGGTVPGLEIINPFA